MSRSSSSALLLPILSHAEDLHARLTSGEGDLGNLPAQLLGADAALRGEARRLLERRDMQTKATQLLAAAEQRQAALVHLATRMQKAEMALADTISRARDALAASDASASSGGAGVPPATLIEYAERVSYSNAAPCSQTAYDGAIKKHFFQGWGTPAPQQNMLGASRFASGQPAALGAPDIDESDGPSPTAAADQPSTSGGATAAITGRKRAADASSEAQPPPPAAPTFTAPAQQSNQEGESDASERAHVKVGFGDSSDEDDDDDEFG
jgi:hypothetical protein